MIQVTIDDIIVDLLPGEVVAITKQVDDLGELKDRQSDFTNKIKLPPTANNRKLYDHADIIGSQSVKPYRRLTASIIDHGVPTMANGYAILDGDYQATLYAATVDFFARLEGLTLRDLDLSDMDHAWTLAKVTASFAHTYTTGYIYPIIDYNGMPNTRDIDVREILPAVFARTIWDRIHSEAGYTWTGDLLTSGRFLQLILPFIPGPGAHGDNNISPRVNVGVSLSSPLSISMGASVVVWQNVVSSATPANYNNSNGVFTFIDKVTVRFDFDISLQNTTGGGIDVIISSSTTGAIEQVTVPASTTLPHTFSWTGTFEEAEAIHFEIEATNFGVDLLSGSGVEAVFISGSPGGIAFGAANNYISMAGIVPEMKQKDFVKAIWQMFSLVPTPDPVTNNIHYNWRGDLTENIKDARDWSAKIDMKSVSVEYRHGDYGQINWLKYKEDDDDIGELGNGSFTVDDQTLEQERDIIELPFAATRMVTRLAGDLVPYIDAIDAGGDFENEVEPRILVLDKQTLIGNGIDYTDGTTTTNQDTNLPYAYFIHPDKTESIGFENNLIDTYYPQLASMLDKVKKVTALFNLSRKDIQKVDHFIPIWLAQYGHYFYLNKIDDFVSGRLTKCTLIRM